MNHDRDFEESDVTGLGALQESCSEKFMPQKMFLPDALSGMPYATLQPLSIPCCRETTPALNMMVVHIVDAGGLDR